MADGRRMADETRMERAEPDSERPDTGYRASTQGFEVEIEPIYLNSHSEPARDHYVWAYRVAIRNAGERTARLVSRHWTITDANGAVETVDGPGVVGQTPLLAPGDSFEYHSGCPLSTPGGTMAGHYSMLDEDGATFDIAIPPFSLDIPNAPRTLN